MVPAAEYILAYISPEHGPLCALLNLTDDGAFLNFMKLKAFQELDTSFFFFFNNQRPLYPITKQLFTHTKKPLNPYALQSSTKM